MTVTRPVTDGTSPPSAGSTSTAVEAARRAWAGWRDTTVPPSPVAAWGDEQSRRRLSGSRSRLRRRGALLAASWMLAGSDSIALLLAVLVARVGAGVGASYGALVLTAVTAAGLYRPRIGGRVSEQTGRILAAAGLPAVWSQLWMDTATAIRLAAIAGCLLIGMRVAATACQRSARTRGLLTQQALIIGTGAEGQRVWRLLREHPELGQRPCAPVGADLASDGAAILETVDRFGIGQVLVCVPGVAGAELAMVVRWCRDRGVRVSALPALPELGLAVPRACLDDVWGVPFIPLRPGPADRWRRIATRSLDLIAGTALLVAAAPVTLVLTVAVWLDFRLPPLFRQVRVVGRGRLATIAKLRTLRPAGDPDTTWAVAPEHETRLGRLLRRTHADELPQLASVVRGDMALVGPRPERPHFARELRRRVPGYGQREHVTAGLTGWAQVHGLTGDTSIEDRARFDNFYIEYWCVWLDLLILARTGLAALSGLIKGGTR